MFVSALILTACTAGSQSGNGTTGSNTGSSGLLVADSLVDGTWQVRMANDQARGPFEGRDAWGAYFQGRHNDALMGFKSENDPAALARMHAEYAAIYRQVTLLSAWSYVQTFGVDAQAEDPVAMSYLVGSAGALLKAPNWGEKLGAGATLSPEVAKQNGAWKSWLDAGNTWPPPMIAGSPGMVASVDPGSLPALCGLPHYKLPHQNLGGDVGGDVGGGVEAIDLGTLLSLALAHEEAAKKADPSASALIAMMIDPWRLPVEPVTTEARPAVPDAWLFLSTATSGGDMAFLADLRSVSVKATPGEVSRTPTRGPEATKVVEQYKASSLAAAVVAACPGKARADGSGTPFVDLDCVLDQAALVAKSIETRMQTIRGKEDSFYRIFSDLARVGIYRAADQASWAAGDTDTMGRLRVNALDRSNGAARDPLFLISVAAWDCGNRNSLRCADLLHSLNHDIPGLEAARFPVDALQIRIGRNAAPAGIVH